MLPNYKILYLKATVVQKMDGQMDGWMDIYQRHWETRIVFAAEYCIPSTCLEKFTFCVHQPLYYLCHFKCVQKENQPITWQEGLT